MRARCLCFLLVSPRLEDGGNAQDDKTFNLQSKGLSTCNKNENLFKSNIRFLRRWKELTCLSHSCLCFECTGRSTGQAYVQFATAELANKALERNR